MTKAVARKIDKTPSIVHSLTDVALKDTDVRVQREAVKSLGKYKPELICGPLQKIIKEAHDPEVRIIAIHVLMEAPPSDPPINTHFLLITALEEERDAVLDKLSGFNKLPPTKYDIRTYYQAELNVKYSDNSDGKYQVILLPILRMGRVKAATATSDAIKRWHPKYVILVGIAGGISKQGIRIGDILIADQIVDYELQKTTKDGPDIRWEVYPIDPRLLAACGNYLDENWKMDIRVKCPSRKKPQRHFGPFASGDKKITYKKVVEKYQGIWTKLIGIEMEASGVATAAFESSEKPGFFMIRCVSDLADKPNKPEILKKWRPYICNAAAAFAITWIKSGPINQ